MAAHPGASFQVPPAVAAVRQVPGSFQVLPAAVPRPCGSSLLLPAGVPNAAANVSVVQTASFTLPPPRVQELADPATIREQKDVYAKDLEEQLRRGVEALGEGHRQHIELLHVNANQNKSRYNIAMDQQVKQVELLLSQEYNEQLMRLQQVAQGRRAELEQQATRLTLEFQQRKVQEEFMVQQMGIQQQHHEAQVRLAEEMQKLGAQPGFDKDLSNGFKFPSLSLPSMAGMATSGSSITGSSAKNSSVGAEVGEAPTFSNPMSATSATILPPRSPVPTGVVPRPPQQLTVVAAPSFGAAGQPAVVCAGPLSPAPAAAVRTSSLPPRSISAVRSPTPCASAATSKVALSPGPLSASVAAPARPLSPGPAPNASPVYVSRALSPSSGSRNARPSRGCSVSTRPGTRKGATMSPTPHSPTPTFRGRQGIGPTPLRLGRKRA